MLNAREFKRLCVFCGSSPGGRPEYARAAEELGRTLAGRGITLVYGAGNVGLMGLLADAALAAGGRVIGIIPDALVAREVAHRSLTEIHVTGSMHERKALMADLADGFIALPGGLGTYEEFFEVLTWAQLGLHAKPCGLLNVAGFYDPLIALLDHAVTERFVKPEHRSLMLVESTPARLIDQMAGWHAPHIEKWLDRREET